MAFLSGEARRFCFFAFVACRRQYSQLARFNVLRQYPTPTTVFILPILLLPEFCFYRTTHDLGLGLQQLILPSELVLLQRRTAAVTARAATATTIEAAALGDAFHIC